MAANDNHCSDSPQVAETLAPQLEQMPFAAQFIIWTARAWLPPAAARIGLRALTGFASHLVRRALCPGSARSSSPLPSHHHHHPPSVALH